MMRGTGLQLAARLAARLAALMWMIVLALPASGQSGGPFRRVALVIGVDGYQHLPSLTKAVGDARAVAQVLRDDLQFSKVITGENLDRRAMAQKLGELDAAIQPGDMVFLFFAGHGVALGSENVLLPADMPKPGHGADGIVRDEGFPVDAIIQRVQRRGAKVTMLVLDACRNNPFEQTGVRSIGQTRGLARIEAPQGVFVLFSAGLGQLALDRLPGVDASATSVFTRHLVPALKTPGLSHVQLAKRVQQEVDAMARDKANGHAQQPAYYDQIVGEIVLKPGPRAVDSSPSDDAGLMAQLKAENEKLRREQVAAASGPGSTAKPTCDGATVAGQCIAPGSGQSFRDCPACPEMVVVPKGTFLMGSPEDEPGRTAGETQVKVTITAAFAVGKFAVTVDEFEAFVKDFKKFKLEAGCNVWTGSTWDMKADATFRNPGFTQSGRHPVTCVNWDFAQAYVAWLSAKTGQTYRLLSESEREYVARAGTTTPFWWGKSITPGHGNYDGNFEYAGGGAKGEYRQRTMPVDSFKPNPWGLYNVHGNVWEWTQDCWADDHSTNPGDGDAAAVGDCTKRVLRGGSWFNYPRALRSADRVRNVSDFRNYNFGFRVARSVSSPRTL
jgi:formylglycine-generating enzyme required for sulfatase activity